MMSTKSTKSTIFMFEADSEEQWKESLSLSAEYTCWSEGTTIDISNNFIIILTSVALYGRELN